MRKLIQEFESVLGFPQAVAAIDCCHICVKAPIKNPVALGTRLTLIQTLSEMLSVMLKQISNAELSPLIFGDSACSLENWLMKPYLGRGNLNPDEARFNFALSRSRVVFENVFGRLKRRSNILQNY